MSFNSIEESRLVLPLLIFNLFAFCIAKASGLLGFELVSFLKSFILSVTSSFFSMTSFSTTVSDLLGLAENLQQFLIPPMQSLQRPQPQQQQQNKATDTMVTTALYHFPSFMQS